MFECTCGLGEIANLFSELAHGNAELAVELGVEGDVAWKAALGGDFHGRPFPLHMNFAMDLDVGIC